MGVGWGSSSKPEQQPQQKEKNKSKHFPVGGFDIWPALSLYLISPFFFNCSLNISFANSWKVWKPLKILAFIVETINLFLQWLT
jgi:hypothetical protein